MEETNLFCIDPGTEESGVVIYNPEEHQIIFSGAEVKNEKLISILKQKDSFEIMLVVEMVSSYGMPVGMSTFETVYWVGRFVQAYEGLSTRIFRKDVKMILCNSMRAKDSNVRQAILDMFAATGGGKTPQVGTKKEPGPLYGVKSHAWSALAVGLAYKELYWEER